MDVIIIVLILMEAIIVLAWMDMNWDQIITLVQVMTALITQYTIQYFHEIMARVLAIWQGKKFKFQKCLKLSAKLNLLIYNGALLRKSL